jgi:hypothetical protein
MQWNHSAIEGHVLSHREESSRPFAYGREEHVHPLKQGLHMFASLILLTSSMGLMYFTTLFVSDMQSQETFSQLASIKTLDRDVKSLSYHERKHGHDFLNA